MDPLSISAGIVGFVGYSLHTARKVKEFVDGIEGAPRAVKALSSDVCALYDVLNEFSKVLNDPAFREGSAKTGLFVTLQRPLENCTNSLEDVKNKIRPFTKPTGDPKVSRWRSVAWTFKEKEVEVLRGQLTAYKASLDIALSVASISATNDARQDINGRIHRLRRHIDLDEDSVRHPTYVGSEAIGTDPGYAIRRYLMETQTEILAANATRSPPGSIGDLSRRASNAYASKQSHLPPGSASMAEDAKKLEDFRKFIERNTTSNAPLQSSYGLQGLVGNNLLYELPASPANPSPGSISSLSTSSMNFGGLAELDGRTMSSPLVLSNKQATNAFAGLEGNNHLSIPMLDGQSVDAAGRSSMPPFTAWELPAKRVFGLSLKELHNRDGFLVPILVQKCVSALRRFAMGMMSIYSVFIPYREENAIPAELMSRFDHDASLVHIASPCYFGWKISNIVYVLATFLRRLPDPLLCWHHTRYYAPTMDTEPGIYLVREAVRNLDSCAQETVKDITVLLHDTWLLSLQRFPVTAPEQLDDLSRTFAALFAGNSTPLPYFWIKALITNAHFIFEYTPAGYLSKEASTAQNYMQASARNDHEAFADRLPTKSLEPEEIFLSCSIVNVSDDLGAMQVL